MNAYNPTNAVNYSRLYYSTPNSSIYKTLDSDCTNFVSQAVAVGGVVFTMPTSIPKPSGIRDYVKHSGLRSTWTFNYTSRTVSRIDYSFTNFVLSAKINGYNIYSVSLK